MPPAYLQAPGLVEAHDLPAFAMGCTGKLRQSRRDAVRTIARRGYGSLYRCVWCGCWHTTKHGGSPPRPLPGDAVRQTMKGKSDEQHG